MSAAIACLALVGIALVTWCGCARPAEPAARLREALHLVEIPAPDLEARVQERWRRRDATVERVVFQGRPGQSIPALVAYSDLAQTRPLPVVLCMPGSPNRKEDLIRPKDLLQTWAQAGFFVLSIDRPYHGERPGDREAAIRDKGLPRVLGEFVYDLGRALDYVGTRPEADATRIGMLGLSMGGMEALLLAAVDERVGCVVSVSGQLSWQDVFADDTWQRLFTGLPMADSLRLRSADAATAYDAFLRRMPELATLDAPIIAAAIAPRPLLLMTGADDPYVTPAAAQRTHDAARAGYDGSGDERLGLWVEAGVGHAFSAEMERRSLAWFHRWLVAP